MSDPVFVRIVDRFSKQLELIEKDAGYNTDIGSLGQMILGLGTVDINNQPNGSIVIEPGRELGFDADGAKRQGVVPLGQRPSRDIVVSVAQTITDRSQWLKDSELIAEDLRKAIFGYAADWRTLSVSSIDQTGQDSGWPDAGSSTLIVQLTFRVTYVER